MGLTQIKKAGLDSLALDHVFTIGASGSSAYTFQGEGLNGTVNNPTLYLTRGKTYRFENGSGGHPIRIQSTSGASGTAYNTGVTNNAGSGTVIVEVQHDAPDVLYYQCTSHAAMNGILYVTGALSDGSVTTAKLADSTGTSDGVTTAKIADRAITASKLAISHPLIYQGMITPNAVTTSNIVDGAVNSDKIANDTIVNADINSSAAIAGTKVNPEFGGQDITTTGDSDTFMQLIKSGTRTWKAKYETNSTIGSGMDTLKITTDLNVGGAGEPGLGIYIDDQAQMLIWDDSKTLDNMPHTNVRPTFAVYGDILVGDIIAIENNPMTYFMRVKTGLDRTKTTNLFCAKKGNEDTDGGPTITMSPNETGAVDSGYISLTAYSQGTGSAANAIRFQNRTGVDTVADRAIINSDGNFGVGKTTGLAARITASHSSGTIGYFESTQGATNAANIVGNSTDNTSSSNLILQVNGGATAQSIVRCNGNNDTVILNGASPTEKARFLASGGLTFNGDTSADNALDDYEQGTWTPEMKFNNANSGLNHTQQDGRYTKIGNMVHASFVIGINNKGSSSGNWEIRGLPFTSLNDTGDRINGMITYYGGMVTVNTHITLYNSTNTDFVYGYNGDGSSTSAQNLTNSNVSNGAHLRGHVWYRAA